MRLALYIPVLDDRPAGLGVYVEELCSRLVALHPDAVVFTGTPTARRPWLDGVEVRPIGPRLFPELGPGAGARRRARRLRWLATFAHRDLAQAGTDVFFSPVQEGLLGNRLPSVVVMHDLTPLRFPEAYGRLHVAQTRWLVPLMLRHATRVVAVSQNTARDLTALAKVSPSKVAVVGEGFDRAVFRPRGEAEVEAVRARFGLGRHYLVYAGTFSRHKNLTVLPEALAHLGPAHADLELVLVGRRDAGRFDEFIAAARRVGVEARLRFPGYVSRDELAALHSGAAAFVYPSRYEGFGLAPLEAMACGAPVIVSNVASLPEVVGAGGRLVDGEGAAPWAAALEATLVEPRAEAGERARAQAARFDWDDAARTMLRILGEVAGT